MESNPWEIERRDDGAIVVRVRSSSGVVPRLPDAVFAFRSGDPQFKFWESRYYQRVTPRDAMIASHYVAEETTER